MMKPFLLLLLFMLCACTQPEPALQQFDTNPAPSSASWNEVEPEFAPLIEITKVTKETVYFEVSNDTPIPFYFIGKRNGDPFATTEIGTGDDWRLSHWTVSRPGNRLRAIHPGTSFRSFVANFNEGPVRVTMSFTTENKWNAVDWISVRSEFHEDWKP